MRRVAEEVDRRAVFLESMDSVRMPWNGPQETSAQVVQLYADVLMTLLIGRDVAVPLPYCIDSLAFQTVAATVLTARDEEFNGKSKPKPHPFRVNLFDQTSFAAALSNTLRRIDGAGVGPPLVSSLFPDLGSAERGTATRFADQIDQTRKITKLRNFLDDQRAAYLRPVWKEFRDAERGDALTIPRSTHQLVNLSTAVALVAEAGVGRGRGAKRKAPSSSEVEAQLRESLNRLRHTALQSGVDAFASRSPIHSDAPWPGSSASAKSILGTDNYGLVVEFVDTYYNALLAATLGDGPVSFSTPTRLGVSRSAHLGEAQEIALRIAQGGTRGKSAPFSTAHPSYLLITRPAEILDRPYRQADQQLLNSLDVEFRTVFRQALALREQEDFKRSVLALDTAEAHGSRIQLEVALAHHISMLSDQLTGASIFGSEPKSMGLGLRLAGRFGVAFLANRAGVGSDAWYAAASTAADLALDRGVARLGKQLARRRTRSAFKSAMKIKTRPDARGYE